MSTDARVTARFTAPSADELYEIGGWAHDAEFDWERITFDDARGVVTIPFAQEVLPEFDQAGPRQVGTGRLGARHYEVPLVYCCLVLRSATAVRVATDGRDDPGMLNSVAFDPRRQEVLVHTVVGPGVRVAVTRVDAEAVVTDRVVLWKKRTVGPGGGELDTWRRRRPVGRPVSPDWHPPTTPTQKDRADRLIGDERRAFDAVRKKARDVLAAGAASLYVSTTREVYGPEADYDSTTIVLVPTNPAACPLLVEVHELGECWVVPDADPGHELTGTVTERLSELERVVAAVIAGRYRSTSGVTKRRELLRPWQHRSLTYFRGEFTTPEGPIHFAHYGLDGRGSATRQYAPYQAHEVA